MFEEHLFDVSHRTGVLNVRSSRYLRNEVKASSCPLPSPVRSYGFVRLRSLIHLHGDHADSLLQVSRSRWDVPVFLLAHGFAISLMDRLSLIFFNSRVGRDSRSHPATLSCYNTESFQLGFHRSSRETVSFSLASSFWIAGVQASHASLRTAQERKFLFHRNCSNHSGRRKS